MTVRDAMHFFGGLSIGLNAAWVVAENVPFLVPVAAQFFMFVALVCGGKVYKKGNASPPAA